MKPYIDQYAPNFVNALGDLYQRFVTSEDVMYALPNIWGILGHRRLRAPNSLRLVGGGRPDRNRNP